MEGTTEVATKAPTLAGPEVGGRRTQLKIVRENIESLSGDVRKFRKNHELGMKKLEKQVAALRSDLAVHGTSSKSHVASSARLEKQVATLRKELAALKAGIAKDAARSKAKQEATLSRILAKVSAKPAKPKPVKTAKKR